MAAALPHSHLRLHLQPHHTSNPSPPRRRRLPAFVAFSRLQNPTTTTHPALPHPAPAPSAALLAAEGASLAPRREHRFPGSVASPPNPAGPISEAANDEAVLRRALEVRRAVAAETLVAALRGGKVGGMTYIKNLTARMGRFVDRVVVEAAAMRQDRPELAHQSFNGRAPTYIQESGLVELVKWFKHNSMTYPQIAKVVCSCSGDLEKVRRMINWLRSIYVKGEFLGRVLANGDSFLNRSFEELEEIVSYLESCGVRRDWIGYVVSRCPQLLNLSMDELETRVRFYTDMGMNEKDFGTTTEFNMPPGLHYSLSTKAIIHSVLYICGARYGGRRWDRITETYADRKGPDFERKEMEKLKDSTQTLCISSVLITTVTFGATFALPGGYRADDHTNGGTPTLAGRYTFDAFVIANTLAFICSVVGTIGLTFSGVPMVQLNSRIIYLKISTNFVVSSLTSLTAAFLLGIYLVLAPVAYYTAVAISVMTPLVLVCIHMEFCLKWAPLARPLRRRIGLIPVVMIITRAIVGWLLWFSWPLLFIFLLPAITRKHKQHRLG